MGICPASDAALLDGRAVDIRATATSLGARELAQGARKIAHHRVHVAGACRSAWDDDRLVFELAGERWFTPPLLKLAVRAFVLRVRVRVWWHLRRGHLKLAVVALDDGVALHFKSYAELAPCCCQPMPDRPGVTSMIVRRILRNFTREHPLELVLRPLAVLPVAAGDQERASPEEEEVLRWRSGLTGIAYAFPLAP